MFALTDGEGDCVLLDVAQDSKRIGDGDTGPEHRAGWARTRRSRRVDRARATEILATRCSRRVRRRAPPIPRVLFAGLMLTADGPKVLEFNCRFGDPETQVLLPRMPYGVATLVACVRHRAARPSNAGHAGSTRRRGDGGARERAATRARTATGLPIDGVDAAEPIDGVTVFHAGTARDDEGRVVTAGGRVLRSRAPARRSHDARDRAYGGVSTDPFRRDALPQRHRARGGRGGRDERRRPPLVGVLAASPSELPIMRQAGLILEKFDIPHEVRVMSSPRNPDLVDEYARTAVRARPQGADLLHRAVRATWPAASRRGRSCR